MKDRTDRLHRHGFAARVVAATIAGTVASWLPAQGLDAVIELPPFIVSDVSGAPPWRYVAAPGIEVLARGHDAVTVDFVERREELEALLGEILPIELRLQTSVPQLVLLVDAEYAPALSKAFLEKFGQYPIPRPPSTPARVVLEGRPMEVRMMPNLRLPDVDALAVFALADRHTFDARRLGYTPEYVRFLLEHRTPPLPRWFIEGWMRMFADATFERDAVRIAALRWSNPAANTRLQHDPDAPRRIQPLADYFAAVPPRQLAGEAGQRWVSQAELMVEWALETPQRRAGLWRFLRRVAETGETEAAAKECLELDYAGWRDSLSDYLPEAVNTPMVIKASAKGRADGPKLRDATRAEIGRIKGDWERLETVYVRRRYPAFADDYLALARDTLARGRKAAPEDRGLLAVEGLLECDLGNFGAARPLLEAAAKGDNARPRVYAELASIRLTDLSHRASAPAGTLNAADRAAVLTTLASARRQEPPLALSDAVMMQAWLRADAPLTADDWRSFDAAIARFPREPTILYFAALVEARYRSIDRALLLIDQAIGASPSFELDTKFRKVRAELVEAKAGTARTGATPSETGAVR